MTDKKTMSKKINMYQLEKNLIEGTVTIKNLKGVKGENNKTFPKSNLIDEIKKLI